MNVHVKINKLTNNHTKNLDTQLKNYKNVHSLKG